MALETTAESDVLKPFYSASKFQKLFSSAVFDVISSDTYFA